jgi:hypothetical protein
VNETRLQGNCSNSLAAAEHYLYARWLCATYSPVEVLPLVAMKNVYDTYKMIRTLFPSLPELKEGSCAPSPVSARDDAWMSFGIGDGCTDFARRLYSNDISMPTIFP